jgi:hypothetical protein
VIEETLAPATGFEQMLVLALGWTIWCGLRARAVEAHEAHRGDRCMERGWASRGFAREIG